MSERRILYRQLRPHLARYTVRVRTGERGTETSYFIDGERVCVELSFTRPWPAPVNEMDRTEAVVRLLRMRKGNTDPQQQFLFNYCLSLIECEGPILKRKRPPWRPTVKTERDSEIIRWLAWGKAHVKIPKSSGKLATHFEVSVRYLGEIAENHRVALNRETVIVASDLLEHLDALPPGETEAYSLPFGDFAIVKDFRR